MRFPCGRRCLLGFVSWLVSVCVTSLKVQAAEPRPETPLRRTGPQGTRNATDNFGSAAAGFAQAPGGGGSKLESVEFPAFGPRAGPKLESAIFPAFKGPLCSSIAEFSSGHSDNAG